MRRHPWLKAPPIVVLSVAVSLGAFLATRACAEEPPSAGALAVPSVLREADGIPGGIRFLERTLRGPDDHCDPSLPRKEEGCITRVANRAWSLGRLALADQEAVLESVSAGPQGGTHETQAPGETSRPGSIDFDLLGPPKVVPQVNEGALRLRRTMLGWHQGIGLAMFGLQLATTVVGQLNYDDKFGGDNTNKYAQTHAILAYSTLATFVIAGALAIAAPAPLKREEGFDRVALHKISMFTATAMMVAQAALGIWTQSREGYLNQQSIAIAHLALGYATLGVVGVGVGALVF